MSFQIRVKTVNQAAKPQQHIIKIEENETLYDVKYKINKLLNCNTSNTNTNTNDNNDNTPNKEMEFLSGFPPKKIILNSVVDEKTILIKDMKAFQPNETILIRFKDIVNNNDTNTDTTTKNKLKSNNKASSKAKNKKRKASKAKEDDDEEEEADNSSSNSPKKKRIRRAAATIAINSFKDTIKAQDAILRKEKKAATVAAAKKKLNNNKTIKKTAAAAHFNNANTSSSSSNNTSSKKINNKKSSLSTFAENTVNRNKNKNKMNNDNDISMQLLSATTNGTGKVNHIIRKAMNNAVTQSYEISRSYIRLSAIQSGKYTIAPAPNSNNAPRSLNSLGMYKITYTKGNVDGGRGNYIDENIELLSKDVVKSVIQTVYNDDDPITKEMLRPSTIAQISLRVLWSLVHHYTTNDHDHNNKANKQDDNIIIKALEYITPELNYDFLNARKKILSQKAKDNLWQESMFNGEILKDNTVLENENDDNDHDEKAINVIMDVQHAMINTLMDSNCATDNGSADIMNKRNRMANAALSRFDNTLKQASTTATTTTIEEKHNNDNDIDLLSWNIETPTEYDEDELRACITNNNNDNNNISLNENDIQYYIQILKNISLNNWRQLANSNSSHIHNSILNQNQNNNNNTINHDKNITEDIIELWIIKAQMESIDEIMICILNNNSSLFLKLRDYCNCGTPKDLSFFNNIPFILKKKILNYGSSQHDEEDENNDDDDDDIVINDEQIKILCKRAKYVIEKWDWLDDYVTPV